MRKTSCVLDLVLLTCAHQSIEGRIETILDSYHDWAILMDFDEEERIAHVAIEGYLTSGADAGCQDFAEMVWRIAELDERIATQVYGSFVPSLVNPISYKSARVLAEGD